MIEKIIKGIKYRLDEGNEYRLDALQYIGRTGIRC